MTKTNPGIPKFQIAILVFRTWFWLGLTQEMAQTDYHQQRLTFKLVDPLFVGVQRGSKRKPTLSGNPYFEKHPKLSPYLWIKSSFKILLTLFLGCSGQL